MMPFKKNAHDNGRTQSFWSVCVLPVSSSWVALLSLEFLSCSLPRPSVVSGDPLCVYAPPKNTHQKT